MGETEGNVRMARGPENKGSRPCFWVLVFWMEVAQARVERPWVNAALSEVLEAEVSDMGVEVAVLESDGCTGG